MKRVDFGVALLMIGVGLAAFIKVWDYPEQSRMMPLIYSSLLMLLSALLCIRSLRGKTDVVKVGENEPMTRVILVIAIIAAYIASIQVIGFYSATTLFMLVFMNVMRAAKWHVSLVVSVLTSVVMYLFFGLALKIPVPSGMFF